MDEYRKYSKWISRIEEQINDMHRHRAATEARISKKISRLVLDVARGDGLSPQAKLDVYNRLNRMALCVEAEGANMSTLEQVEREVDRIYGDQSDNSSYYFSRKAKTVLEEMQELTTFDPEDVVEPREAVLPEQDFEGVRGLVSSEWEDFS